MFRLFILLLLSISVCGCSGVSTWKAPPVPSFWSSAYSNPVMIPSNHPEFVWEQIVDVTDDYFRIMEEVPVRDMVGSEGRLETLPVIGATLLEPWRHDSANFEERLESTMQTIQRRAIISVKKEECGYVIEVAVYKELEDREKPDRAVADSAAFSYTATQIGVIDPVTDEPLNLGWIPLGRDAALEQRILSEITSRLGVIQPQCAPGG